MKQKIQKAYNLVEQIINSIENIPEQNEEILQQNVIDDLTKDEEQKKENKITESRYTTDENKKCLQQAIKKYGPYNKLPKEKQKEFLKYTRDCLKKIHS